jgi:hypothetical protein
MTDAPAYGQVLGRNVSAARGRMQLPQSALAGRMRDLGFPWKQQTVAVVEKGRRRATAEEILGLALALDTTIARLMSASEEESEVKLPAGQVIGAVTVERLAGRGVNDRSILWDGTNVALVATRMRMPGVDSFDRKLLAQPDWADEPQEVDR